jgi:CBS domain-containing protein
MPYRPIRTIIKDQKLLTCAGSITVVEAARLMRVNRIGALMIVEDGKLAGIFTERDALFRVIANERDAKTTQVAEAMTRNLQTIDPDKPLGHALHLMNEGGFRHVPVVENGQPVGMVSARDALGPELEDFAHELLLREQIEQVLA